MEELEVDIIKKRAVRGAAILTGRNIFIQAVTFISVALLTVFLAPSEFGVFFLVSAVINFLAYFGDIGFAASLIQKKESLTNADLKTVFTSQLILVLFIILLVFITSPYIADFYKFEVEAVTLLWAFAFSLLLSSLKTIPTVLMERKLEFNKWVIPQLVEVVVFNIVAVSLAYLGFGITSFTIAVLLRGFSGLTCTYIIRPWIPGISFSLNSLKSILKFGVPYQANTLLAMVKDDGMTLFLGGVLGTSGIGLLGWAQKWAYSPLRFFMDQIIKVTFPAFSRLQDKREELSDAVSKSIFFVCFLVFPSLVFLTLAAPTLIDIIPKYNKWEPALFALNALAISSALAAVTTPLTNTLSAIGKINITFKLMIMWTALTWIFVPFLAIRFGLNGAAIGFTLVGITSIIALLLISKYVKVNYWQSVGKPAVASILMAIAIFFTRDIMEVSFLQIVFMGMVGFAVYVLSMLILGGFKNMLKIIIFLLKILILSIFLFNPLQVNAQTNSYVSVVNPVRGEDFWDIQNQRPTDVIKGQADILKKYNISATWLLRFDALKNKELSDLLNNLSKHEKGLFLEITPTWANAAKVKYHESDNWHDAGSAFLSGYERDERIRFIDSAFEEFKKVFNFYPKSVGAWWIDSFSLEYLQEKYKITGALIVSDQYTTDNYQIWGQYFGTPYYPSKKHILHPAQTNASKLPVVLMQWASRDPINGYGAGVWDSTYSVQANDYKDFHNLNTRYFERLVDIYTKQNFNWLAHLVVGLENSYLWEKYKGEYENQIRVLTDKQSAGQFKISTMQEFSSWYLGTFTNLSPSHLIVADDLLGTGKKAVWFMNPYYRAGWFFNKDGSLFRDIRQYRDGEEEPCLRGACNQVNFATSATRVLDEVSFGHKLSLDEGQIFDFNVKNEGENFVISYKNEAGKERKIEFLPRDISIDGKITSIDETILNAIAEFNSESKEVSLEHGSFAWSWGSVLSKTLKFALFLILACFIPGYVFTRKVFLGVLLGVTLTTLLFYISSILNLRFLILFYVAVSFVIFIRLRLFKKLKFKILSFGILNVLIILIILAGTIFQVIPTFRNGLSYPYGVGFWGPNTHDGVWHIALINQLVKDVPPQNPIFAGDTLKNYHYFYDLLIVATTYFSNIPISDLIFRFYPILFSLLLGIGTYYLSMNLFKNEIASIFSLYLVYFAGSFGWIVEYIKFRHLGGESAFWANQSISFNLNPPFAISLLMVIAIFLLLPNLKSKLSAALITILAGSLIAFKAYGAILILISLLLVGIAKRNLNYLIVFLTSSFLSAILFLSNFSIGNKLIIFSPFWFIHSMIDSPDRVGWARLSLARVAGLEQNNWFKFAAAEAISLIIFIAGNLGTRIFALFSLIKIKNIFKDIKYLFLFIFSALSFFIPILFIQAGNPWNTIQFLYYFLYVSAVMGGIVFAQIALNLPKVLFIPIMSIFLIVTPINSWATANGYLSYNPHAFISTDEFEALEFLKSQEDGVVLTFPYDPKLKNKIAEPWPIFVYDSTAYVSALSNKGVFVEDEPQNQILLTDYKKRIVASRDFFIDEGEEFLRENNIRYIYLPKELNMRVETDNVKNIFENEKIIIYQYE